MEVIMKGVIVISSSQFGYNTDTYFYCKYLSKYTSVTYIGFNKGLPEKTLAGIKILHVDFLRVSAFRRRLLFYRMIKREAKSQEYTHAIFFYFSFCSALSFSLPSNVVKIVDIRTSFVVPSSVKRYLLNKLMVFECSLFKNLTLISDSLGGFLKIRREYDVLPLGGEAPDTVREKEKFFKMLYIGTFYDRNIEITVFGFRDFLSKIRDRSTVSYRIIGFGSESDIKKIKDAIIECGMENYVHLIGEVRYPELQGYLDDACIGVSFIPLTDYYDCQPPTKTFEYLLNGLAVIGTNTSENRRVINEQNGILCSDTVESFSISLLELYQRFEQIESYQIRQSSNSFCWQNIVETKLLTILNKSVR